MSAMVAGSRENDSALGARNLVGRDREIERLTAAVKEAASGHGRMLFVSGEAGMGKSRLLEEIAAIARNSGMFVASGRCWETIDTPAYWPWIQVFRELLKACQEGRLPDITDRADAELVATLAGGMPPTDQGSEAHVRFSLFDSMDALLEAAATQQPLLVILDDLHAADEPSIQLLQFISAGLRQHPLLIVGSYDDVNARRSGSRWAALTAAAREGEVLELRPLDVADVARLYQHVTGQAIPDEIASTMFKATEGNPLFLQEAMKLMSKTGDIRRPDYSHGFKVPEGIRGLIRLRLEALSDEVTGALSIASVIGREFDVSLLGAVSGIEVEDLLALVAEGLVTDIVSETSALGRYSFTHILIRETLYEDLRPAERMRLHRKIAEVLESSFAENLQPRLPELAHHWFKAAQAGDAAKTMDYALQAAEHSMMQGAYEEATRLYHRALKVSEAAGATRDQLSSVQEGLQGARSAADSVTTQPPDETTSGVFAREGDYWTIIFGSKTSRLKDIRGLRHIAQLLKNPNREIHALDLIVGGGKGTSARAVGDGDDLQPVTTSDAGAILDDRAKSAYRRRLRDLQEELEEAQAFNDSERATRAQVEVDALVEQLAGGLGLGGRDRKAASQAERARISVTKAVKEALKRIGGNDPALGLHFRATLRTGTYCSYCPDPRVPIEWEVR